MPLLDHFHLPLQGPRRWEGFHHAWATNIAQHLNREVLPAGFVAEPEISLGPTLEIDVANVELKNGHGHSGAATGTAAWVPPKPALSFPVDFSRLSVCEVRVYADLGGAPPTRIVPGAAKPLRQSAPATSNTPFPSSSSTWLRTGPPTCTRICWKRWRFRRRPGNRRRNSTRSPTAPFRCRSSNESRPGPRC